MTNEWIQKIEEALHQYLMAEDMPYRRTAEAMIYSVEAGGKRIRPLLVLEFCRMLGGNPEKALPLACAVEMIHTYSLIHDDLPCMDNDDLRRGKPSCHKQYDEATALLAGDALLTKAFETIAAAHLSAEQCIRAVSVLSRCAGIDGMVGGQVIDLQNEKQAPTASILELTCRLKTAALLQASCVLGVIAANGTESDIRYAREYGLNLGIAFQIIDDILDIAGDTKLLGKPVGSDAENEKVTFASLYGLEKAREMAAKYTQNALTVLSGYSDNQNLMELTEQLLLRNY
ncbi:MAG: polyprenyl synthetase family protein [Candidatus Merdivicinus sp.]|jgi:geranylgeranyl diphosphate synthase type II